MKSQSGPIHVLLVNKDAAANSPVVTPVPPPANDVNNHTAIKEEEEPMEISAPSKHANNVNSKVGAVKTEVLESSRGILLVISQLFSYLYVTKTSCLLKRPCIVLTLSSITATYMYNLLSRKQT